MFVLGGLEQVTCNVSFKRATTWYHSLLLRGRTWGAAPGHTRAWLSGDTGPSASGQAVTVVSVPSAAVQGAHGGPDAG